MKISLGSALSQEYMKRNQIMQKQIQKQELIKQQNRQKLQLLQQKLQIKELGILGAGTVINQQLLQLQELGGPFQWTEPINVTIEPIPPGNTLCKIFVKGARLCCNLYSRSLYLKPNVHINSAEFNLFTVKNDTKQHCSYICLANTNQYIGCPLQSNTVCLYASACMYTKWMLVPIYGKNNFRLIYIGTKFNPAKIQLVVARYNECINWVIPYADIAVVYNKGSAVKTAADITIKTLPNIGREGHTYLYHIINTYNSTALSASTRIVFLQADPFPHNPTVLIGLEHWDEHDDVQSLGLRYLESWKLPPNDFVQQRKTITNYGLETLEIQCDDHFVTDGFDDVGLVKHANEFMRDYYVLTTDVVASTPLYAFFDFCEIVSYFPNVATTNRFGFSYCGLFSVTKQNITSRPVVVYENLMRALTCKNEQGGVMGYLLEKLWLYIFSALE